MDEYKEFNKIPPRPTEPSKPITNRERVKIYVHDPKEPVVGSKVGYKPVDRVAARVVSAAPWWAQAPKPEPKFMKQADAVTRDPDHTEHESPGRIKSKRMLTEKGYVEELIDAESVAPFAVDQHGRSVKSGIKAADELLEKSRDVIASIGYLSNEIRGPFAEYQEWMNSALKEVRENRIAMGSETRILLAELRDVRTFFLDANYEKEIDRLHRFVDLCERLKALKADGTLDAMADTILKMSGANDRTPI